MTSYKELCAKVLAYNEGKGQYNFSHLDPYDRENAAFDAWQEIKAELKSALDQDSTGPSDAELDQIWDDEAGYFNLYEEARAFARAVLARWGDN